MRLLLIALFLNCQVQSNPTLADEFVHGEVQTRKRIIEQAFALWQVRGQVEVSADATKNQHRIVFTDTCQEDYLARWRTTCYRALFLTPAAGACSFKPHESVIMIRRTAFQALPPEGKLGLLAHEIGHCMGMSHSDDVSELMYPIVSPDNLVPREAEVAKLHTIWPQGHLFKFYLYERY